MSRLELLVLTLACVSGCRGGEEVQVSEAPAAVTGIRFLADGGEGQFARALDARNFVFPRDHGPHPDYRTEWWYLTGNLTTAGSRHFGFELTFFRIGLAPRGAARESAWAGSTVWMAHLAVTDTAAGRFHAAEKLSRGGLGLAGARAAPLEVWVEDWTLEERPDGTIDLRAETADAAIDLRVSRLERITLQGDAGLDAKGPEPGNASYYYSVPRLGVAGTIRSGSGATRHQVEGTAWLDREWGTSALSGNVVGWDWFALQLDDGRDLMFYRLRQSDGGMSPESNGSITYPEGRTERLAVADVEVFERRFWRSPITGVVYPVAWQLRVPGRDLELSIEPYLDNQEVDLTVRYWEGAVKVTGTDGEAQIFGQGYLELAGYQ